MIWPKCIHQNIEQKQINVKYWTVLFLLAKCKSSHHVHDTCLCLWSSFNGLAQDCSITIANALEILQSCTKPSIWTKNEKDPSRIADATEWTQASLANGQTDGWTGWFLYTLFPILKISLQGYNLTELNTTHQKYASAVPTSSPPTYTFPFWCENETLCHNRITWQYSETLVDIRGTAQY